tara:strand:+ start:4719 stop:7280 length:2562 start_codon:yes stop_codon:yes gene_type:complete
MVIRYINFTQTLPIVLTVIPILLGLILISSTAFYIIPLTISLNSQLSNIQDFSVDSLTEPTGDSVSELKKQIESTLHDLEKVSIYEKWASEFSSSVALIPGTETEILNWFIQLNRVRDDLRIASDLIDASVMLTSSYQNVQDRLLDEEPSVSSMTNRLSPITLQETFSSTANYLGRHIEINHQREPALLPHRIRKLLSKLNEVELDLLNYSNTGRMSSLLLGDILGIADNIKPLIGTLANPQQTSDSLTFQDLMNSSVETSLLIDSATHRSQILAEHISSQSGALGHLNTQLDVLVIILDILDDINNAVLIGLHTIHPLSEVVQDSNTGLLNHGDVIATALLELSQSSEDINKAIELLKDANQKTSNLFVEPDGYLTIDHVNYIKSGIEVLIDGFTMIGRLSPVGPDIIGIDSIKHYLILGQSSDELRATGGFVSAIWLVTFENGTLTNVLYHDTVRVDDWDRLELYPTPPIALKDHMNASVWLLRDVSWEPDFPTTANTAADMYKIGQRQDVDGVIAINQWALKNLIESLGEVEVIESETTVTSDNILSKLEEGSDQFGRAYIDLAFNGILNKLKQPISPTKLISLASELNQSLDSKDILLFFNNNDTQKVIEENGWDGSLFKGKSDYLYVIDSNVGWSKADRNIERKATYEVDLNDVNNPRVNLVLSYTNHSISGSPSCEPQWLHKGSNYNQLKNACYWNYWRVIVPQGAKLLSNSQLPLPRYSVSSEIGRGLAGEDTVGFSSSHNRNVLSGLFELDAGKTKEFNLVYELPPNLLKYNYEHIEYELFIQKQPGSVKRQVLVEIILPDSYQIDTYSHAPNIPLSDTRISFQLSVKNDTLLKLTLSRIYNESS